MPSNAFQSDSNALQSNAVWQEAMPKIDITGCEFQAVQKGRRLINV